MQINYFTTSWCMPCKALSPFLEGFMTNYPEIKFVKHVVDKSEEDSKLAEDYNVKTVPKLVGLSGGSILILDDNPTVANLTLFVEELRSMNALSPSVES
jgi:thiol-disulfide isomerase/thioredoxin